MKKLLLCGVLLAIVSFIVWSSDPLNDTVNFIIAGSVPGTDFSIGLWSTIALATALLWAVYRGFKRTQLQMLEQTAKQIKTEQAQNEFEGSHKTEFDRSKRSVIAAPTRESLV